MQSGNSPDMALQCARAAVLGEFCGEGKPFHEAAFV